MQASKQRGIIAAGLLLLLASIAMGMGIAILVTDDHLTMATPDDAYLAGPLVVVLGLSMAGFAVAAYRNNRND